VTALVSIITPSYNQAAYLEDTIRSVLSQEGVELEYLIVDGGSTDDSIEIIRRYADSINWWVSEPDEGQAAAINKGFQRAQGEYVAWLNSDDLLLPNSAHQAVQALEDNPADGLVFGDALTIDPNGKALKKLRFDNWGLRELLAFRIICQPAVFMRRSVLEKAGYLDPSYHYMLDHHLWIRMATQAPIRHVSSTWAAARHHAEAKNVANAPGFAEETFRIVAWMQTTPELEPHYRANRRHILGGAYRLKARYLLDGNLAGASLKAYLRAVWYNPAFAMQHWHRMLYAILSLMGGRGLANVYYRMRGRDL
jgi:glycosyltransferase involved in cell wall biosynthesis